MATGQSSFMFTEEEVQQELARLGITNIDKASLQQFRNELRDLIQEVSASSTGFPDGSSTSTGIGSGTCSDSSDAEGKHYTNKSPDSSSLLSIPSPLLTPPLSRNGSGYNVAMISHKNFQTEPKISHCNDVDAVRRAWEEDLIDPPVPPPSWKNPQLGRIRQVNLNSGPKPSSSMEYSTIGSQKFHEGRPYIDEGISRGISSSKSTVFPNKTSNPDSKISTFSESNEIHSNREPDRRSQNKENATSYERPSTTLLPPETKNEEPVPHSKNGNGLLLEELLRACKSDKYRPEYGNNVPPAKKLTKRKIARKDATGKTYVDESYTESESGSLLDPADYLERLREMNKTIYEVAAASSEKSSDVASSAGFSSVTDGRPKSVILAPRFQKNKKCDPVNRYHELRDYWALHKIPGETKHSELRWFIKERMMHHDQIEHRPRKVYVPNDYVVPTEKPRHSLRWQIRTDLAYGFMPSRERSYSSCS